MANDEPTAGGAGSRPRSEACKTALTVLQSAKPPFVPDPQPGERLHPR
ncbi:hypothetical protein SNOUR_02120 [Streptomyces noursei ATCC 11455]|nr:hypothetical protein SNOUR_02120 [Streptomyces noursei ATCC 11455]